MDRTGDILQDEDKTSRDDREKNREVIKNTEKKENQTDVFGIDKVESVLLKKHSNLITVVKSDGCYVVSGDEKGLICVWELNTNNCLHTLILHEEPVIGLALMITQTVCPTEIMSEKFLVTGSKDGVIGMWSLELSKKIMSLVTDDALTCLEMIEGDKLVIGTGRGKLVCRRLESFRILDSTMAHSSGILHIAVQKDSLTMASMGQDSSSICVWSLSDSRFQNIYTFLTDGINVDGVYCKLKCLNIQHGKVYAADDRGFLSVFDPATETMHTHPDRLNKSKQMCTLKVMNELIITCYVSDDTSETFLSIYHMEKNVPVKNIKCVAEQVLGLACVKVNNQMVFIIGGSELEMLKIGKSKEDSTTKNNSCERDDSSGSNDNTIVASTSCSNS